MKSKARKRKPGGGRKPEGRVKVTWYVLPLTKTRVEYLVGPKANTPGKVVDSQFGVRATKKVAGARGGSAGSARADIAELSGAQSPIDLSSATGAGGKGGS